MQSQASASAERRQSLNCCEASSLVYPHGLLLSADTHAMTQSTEVTTRTARIIRTADDIVIVRVFPNVEQTVEDAMENVRASVGAGTKKCAILTDLRDARPLSPEARHYYSGKTLTDYFRAMGLLVPASPFGRMMGNVYLRVANPGIPAKLFADESEALAWLRKHCQ